MSVPRTRTPKRLGWVALAVPALALAQEPPSPQAVAEALRAGRAEEAVQLADRWSLASPTDPRPHAMQGIALGQLGRAEDAVRAFERALGLEPTYLPALQGAAELEFRLGRPQARQRLERIVELQPSNATAHAMLGVLAYAARDCAGALDHFSRGSPAVDGDPEAVRQRAECRFEAGRFYAAAEDFRRLLDEKPANPTLQHNLGLALHEAGRHEAAAEALSDAVSSAPDPDVDTLTLLAEAQRAALDIEGALATLQLAVRSHPRNERLYLQLAEVCIEHGAYDLGLEIVGVAIQNIPDPSSILTMRGILLAELGRYDEAEAAFEAAARADPDGQSAAVGLSLTLEKTGRIEESLDVLRERSERNPDDAVALFFYAQALIKRGVTVGDADFDAALAALASAAEKLPREAAPRIELGKLHLKAGRPLDAIAPLEEALRLAPDDRQAVYNLMLALRRAGRSPEAAEVAVRMREQLNRSKDEEVRRNRLRLVRTGDDGTR